MTIPFANPPRPGWKEELRALRASEKAMASRAALVQFIEARLCAVYGYAADIHVDYEAEPGAWRHVDRSANLMRHGKPTVLPPHKLITNPAAWPFYIAPDVAQALIRRDGSDPNAAHGKPI